MRHISRGLLAAIAAAVAPAAFPQTCNTGDRAVALVLDASGSMNARLPGGETRMTAAQRAVKGVAALVAPEAQLGLRLYGARSPAAEKNCDDSHLAVAFAPAGSQAAAIGKAVDGARAQGWTPIAHSLEQAANDFPAGAKERVIVLVSDGKETCKGDPVLAARALAGRGITVHTIGFVVDSAAKMQLQAVAKATGGSYFEAPQGTELPETLKAAIQACRIKPASIPTASSNPGKLRTTASMPLSAHEVLDVATGKKVGALDNANREIKLPAGVYEVRFGPATWKGIEVRSGETTTIEPGMVKLSRGVNAQLVDVETGAKHGSFNPVTTSAAVMPGLYDLEFKGGLRWPHLRVDGGKTLTLDPIEIRLSRDMKWKKAQILHGGKPVARFDAVTYAHVLPPGEYLVEVDGKRHPVSAAAGGSFEIGP